MDSPRTSRLDWEALRAAYPDRGEEDQIAALGWSVDADGAVHLGPLTVKAAIESAADLAKIELGGESPFTELD